MKLVIPGMWSMSDTFDLIKIIIICILIGVFCVVIMHTLKTINYYYYTCIEAGYQDAITALGKKLCIAVDNAGNYSVIPLPVK